MVKAGKPQSMIQMREHLATCTYYGASASSIRHLMMDHPDIFIRTGKTTKVSTTGAPYEIDTYYLTPSYLGMPGGHAVSDDAIIGAKPKADKRRNK